MSVGSCSSFLEYNPRIYCGPLRLLAWEVAKRLKKANVPCDLVIGQEREEVDGAKHKAQTVYLLVMWSPSARTGKQSLELWFFVDVMIKKYKECSGIYCGPLRLLAWEVAKRLKKANVPCDLITGQEREEVDGAKLFISWYTSKDQRMIRHVRRTFYKRNAMLGCRTRGFSFTRALLGISADELHLWGDPSAIPLIQEILKSNW
ncbi:hypothetical protein Pint_25905 [Pistacia integerrima]|uniref:Uncharacterized protein n=1 Tax=Pistacia integerrima TaxID=434235 RepID=A0ACC0YAP4_9ROSI|nr:hypothetical protein Pint_25905 [Pistacia integerrima]